MALAPEEAESRLVAELLAAVDDTALTEAEYQDPEEFAAAVLNNLPAIAYALSAGMTVTRWRPLQRNVAEEQRILRAVRQWGEQARRLIVAYLQGTIAFDDFVTRLMAAYQQHARNAYVAGHRAVGDLAPLTGAAEDSLAALSNSDAKRLQDSITAPAAGGTVGVGALLQSMFSPSAIFTPSNYLGSGLPGDPFKDLPPPLGAGGGHKPPRAPRVAPTATPQIADGLEPLAEPLEDRDVASQAMRTYLDRVDGAGSLIGTYAKKGEIDALTQTVPGEAVLSWWVLGAADHCIDCVRLSEMSPYYASSLAADGIYPGSGHTRCGYRCQCHIEHHVPAEICTDPMKGPGSLGANPADFIESEDGRRINVWVQEAASCRNPQSIDAFAAQNGLLAIAGEDPFNWSDDVASAMEADQPISYTDLTAQQQRAFGFLGDIVPGGRVEPLLATRYRLDGAEYHALWQRSGGALRFEVGATTAGIGALDPEFTLRAIHDLAAIADREGLRLEVNGATRNAGMARWLDTIGAESGSIGAAAPALEPNFAEMDALAEQALPKAGIAPRVTTILPTPTFVEAAADQLPAWPDMGLLKETPGAKALKGANPKKILIDPAGQQWLFKAGLAERPEADAAATEIARRLGMRVPPVQKIEWGGVAGTIQPIVPDARALDRVIDKGQITAEALDAEGMREAARQSVVDFVLANNDTHGGNWILDEQGRLWGIDKGRSYVGGVVASMNPKGFFNPTGGMGTLMGGAVTFPERSHIWERLRPSDMAEVFNRLDGITPEEFGAISHDVLPLIANPFGTPQESLDVLLQRKAGARARFEQWFRDELDRPEAKPSPEWKAWRKAGGTFDVAPVAPAGQPERLLPAPPAAKPTPPEMRSSATFESRVGNDLGVLPADFVPATTMPGALDRLSAALPKTTGNVTGGFSLGQINAIVARAEAMGDMGVDMRMLTRLGDFTLVPKADQARGIGLTYKGDRIALNHDFRWKFLAGVDSPDTVYNDIGGLFAHEYGHVAFAHLGSEAQGKVIGLYKAHAAEAGKDLSTYAAGDVDEWAGEMMAAITTPGYVPGTLAYDDEFWTALVGDGAAKGKVKKTGAPGLLKKAPEAAPTAPVPTEPVGPPKKAPAQTWLKQGDPQQYLIPETDLPVNVPATQWSGYVPPEPPLPSVATAPEQHAANKAALAAAQQAHDAVVIDWHDVADGKAKVAFSWGKTETDKAIAAGLHVEKVGTEYVVAKGTQDLEPLKAFIAQGGDANSDDFWHLMGYSDSDLSTYDAYYALKKSIDEGKGLRLTAGVVMVEPDGRMWVLAPRNKFAGYENTWIKGGVDVGESTADAAVREMMEEAGFSVELDHYLGDYVNTDRTGVARMYVGHRSGGGPLWAHAKETYEVRLVAPDEAKDMLIRYGKPDQRDQKILADAVAAMTGKPGVAEAVIPAGGVGELAAKTAPEPVLWWPEKKPITYGGPGAASPLSPKAGIAPEPPVSTAFGFDHTTWKSFTPTESPPDKVFPYTKTHWKLADGTTQTMYWQVQPSGTGLFWANSKKQIADPHQRLSLHVAQITRMSDVMKGDAAIQTLRVSGDLLGNVPGLRDLFIAAGATAGPKGIEIAGPELHALADAIKNNTPLGKAGVAGTIPTAPMNPVPKVIGSLGVSGADLGAALDEAAYVGDVSLTEFNSVEWGVGTTTGWQASTEVTTGAPYVNLSGPGIGWTTDSYRDMMVVGSLTHMDAVLKWLPPETEIRLWRSTWGDMDQIATTLGLGHPYPAVWTATPEQIAQIATKAKAEMAAAGHAPALLDFAPGGSAVAQPALAGLYKPGTVQRFAAAAPDFDEPNLAYGYGKTSVKWALLPNPLSPQNETFTFLKPLTKGPDAMDAVFGIAGHFQKEIEGGAVYSLRFNKPVLDAIPGLSDILKANGALPLPGHPVDLWMDEATSNTFIQSLHNGLPLPGAVAAAPPPMAITGSPVAAAAAAVVTPASSAGTVDLLANLTESKAVINGIPLVYAEGPPGVFTWRRLGNDLELHGVEPDTFTAAILRMGKAADEAPKVGALRIKPGAWGQLNADERSLVIQAGGKIAPSGTVSLPRDNLLMLRDQMTADLKATSVPPPTAIATAPAHGPLDMPESGDWLTTPDGKKWQVESVNPDGTYELISPSGAIYSKQDLTTGAFTGWTVNGQPIKVPAVAPPAPLATILPPPIATILPGIGVKPDVIADLQVAIVPQKQGFVRTEYAHGSWASPVAIRQRNLSDTIVWSNVSSGTEAQRLTAGVRHLTRMAEQMDGNPKLQYVRFENLAQMPTKFADWIGVQGAYSSGTVVLLKREDLLALRDAIEPEMAGHAAVTTAVGGIASPPVNDFVSSLGVPLADVQTLLKKDPVLHVASAKSITAEWGNGANVAYEVDLPAKSARINGAFGAAAPERNAAVLAEIRTLTGFVGHALDQVEVGPGALAGPFGQGLRDALLSAGALAPAPDMVVIDKAVAPLVMKAIDDGVPLGQIPTPIGSPIVVPASPAASGASLGAQLGYAHDDFLNTGKTFASDDVEQTSGELLVQVPGAQYSWLAAFNHNKAGTLEFSIQPSGSTPGEATVATLWSLSHISGKMQSGAISDAAVLLGGAIPQPVRDLLASQGWAGTETEFLITKGDLAGISDLVESDTAVGKAVAGSAVPGPAIVTPKDPFVITGVDEEEWADLVKGSVADTANVPAKANVYGDVVQTYSLSPSGAIWISTSVEDQLGQTAVTTHSMAFLHDLLKGASDAGAPIVVVSNNVAYDDMQHWIADVLKEYGATPDGNALVMKKAEAQALLADMESSGGIGAGAAVPTPTLPPAPAMHLPTYPAKYGFNATAVDTLTSIRTVTPKPQGFVDIAWGTEKAKYRQSSTTLTLVAGPKGAKASEAWVDTMLHLGEVADATPSVKQIRVALGATPDSLKMQMLTDLGKGALDGTYITVERKDFLAMRDSLVADLGGKGVPPAGPAIAAAADSVQVGTTAGNLVNLHVGDKFDWGGSTWEVTGLDVPGDKVHMATSSGAVAMPASGISGAISNVVPAPTGPTLHIGQQVDSVTGITWEVTNVATDGVTYELTNPATGKTVASTIKDLQQGGWDLGPAFAAPSVAYLAGPNPETVGLAVGDVLVNPAGKPFTVVAVQPNGMFSIADATGMTVDDILPGGSNLKKAAAPPPKMHLAYGVNEQILSQYEADIATAGPYQSWAGWGGKSYTTQYKDATVVAPMGNYGYPTLHVVGGESTVVRIEGKRHVARWTIDRVTYGTEEQQTAAVYLQIRRMVADSAGMTPVFVSQKVLDAVPQIGRLMKGAGGVEKTFSNYGAGLDLDKAAVAKLKAKFDASAGVAIATPVTAAVNVGDKLSAGTVQVGMQVGATGFPAEYLISAVSGTKVTLSTLSGMEVGSFDVSALGTMEVKVLPAGAAPTPTPPVGAAAAPTAPAVPAAPPTPVVPPGAIGAPPTGAAGTISGPAIAPPAPTPSFLYGYDPAYVATAKPADLGTAKTKVASEKAESEKQVMGLGQSRGYWSVAPSGSKTGLWDFEYPAGMDVSEARSAAFAMLLKVAEDGAARPKGFFVKPEFYDKVEGLRQIILDAGGVEATYPNLGTAVEMTPDAAQKLFDALKADQMGPIKVGFAGTADYLGYDATTAKTLFSQAPLINGKTGDFTWDVGGTKAHVIASTNADKTAGAIWSVKGTTVTSPLAVVAQINWLADMDVAEITVAKEILDAVPGLRQWLLTAGGKVDGGVIRLDQRAVGSASKLLVKDSLPVGLGGVPLPYSPFDDLRADAGAVTEALNSHSIDPSGPVNKSTFAIGGATVGTRWTQSATNIFWESIDKTAVPGSGRTVAAAQLRAFADTIAQSAPYARLDVGADVLKAQPGLRAALLHYHATEVPATADREAYLTLTRPQVLKMREDIETELDVWLVGQTPETYIEAQAQIVKWPTVDTLKPDKARTLQLTGAKSTAGAVAATDKLAIYVDGKGEEWLFKPGFSGRGAVTDAAISDLARRLGLPVPPTKIYTIEIDGKQVMGSLQKMLPGAKGVKSIADLDPAQTEDMLRHSVLDWITNNDDGHAGNWLIAPDGHLWAIDKSRSYLTWHGSTDRLYTDNPGNGYKALMFEFFGKIRKDPTLLKTVHPGTVAPTLRALSKISDADFRRMMTPVAEANAKRLKVTPAQMLDQMVARKNEAVGDFEKYFKGEIDTAIAANPSSVPDDWKAWSKAGGKININATPYDLAVEDYNMLVGKYGEFSKAKYDAAIGAQCGRAAAVMDQYIDGGLRDWAQGGGVGKRVGHGSYVAGSKPFTVSAQDAARLKGIAGEGSYAANIVPFLAPPTEYQQWLELQRWATLSIIIGNKAGPRSATFDKFLREMWDPKTATVAVGRGSGRFASPKAAYDDWVKEGEKSVRSFAVPGHEWGGNKFFAKIGYDQIITSVATDITRQEYEFLVRNIRSDQLIRVQTSTMAISQVHGYSGPVV